MRIGSFLRNSILHNLLTIVQVFLTGVSINYNPEKLAEIRKGFLGLTNELLKSKFAYHSIVHKCSIFEDLIKESFKGNPEYAEEFLKMPGTDQISLICEIPFIDRSSETYTSSALPVVYANDAWHFYITDMGE